MVFVYRSFYGMRIKSDEAAAAAPAAKAARRRQVAALAANRSADFLKQKRSRATL